MVNKCSVPKCRGNYDNNTKVHVFKFPSDEELRRKWIQAIKRENFKPTKYSVVCELHFQPFEILTKTVTHCDDGQEITLTLKYPRLSPGAIPSVMPNCPIYLSHPSTSYRESPGEKRLRLENKNLRAAIEQSETEYAEWENEISFKTFEEFRSKLKLLNVDNYWSVIEKEDSVLFIHIDCSSAPKITTSVVIDYELKVSVYYRDQKLTKLEGNTLLDSVNKIIEISSILEKVRLKLCFDDTSKSNNNPNDVLALISNLLQHISQTNSKFDKFVTFMLEQINLINKKRSAYHYSSWFLILSCMLFTISPHCYKYLRHLGFIIFPHPSTIRRLCSSFGLGPQMEQNDSNFLMYTRKKYSHRLSDNNKLVTLMMDEIHLKSAIDFKGGSVVGAACNNQQLATTAHTFMISSILSDLKDVVHIVPVNKMCAEELNKFLRKVILGLDQIGFHILCVVSDNNSIDRKCMQLFSPEKELKFSYNHPAEDGRPLFFLFDSVHLLKCIRNNWINQKNENPCIKYPDFGSVDGESVNMNVVSFAALRKLHEIEECKMVKYGYGLTYKSLYPSALEKQNVSSPLSI